MTYNFDPDAWLAARLAVLDERHRRGELASADLDRERTELDRRYQEMLDRLDGSYQIPSSRVPN